MQDPVGTASSSSGGRSIRRESGQICRSRAVAFCADYPGPGGVEARATLAVPR
jgi:hypothetical protein